MATTKEITRADRAACDKALTALVATGKADDRTRFVRAAHLVTLRSHGYSATRIANEWKERDPKADIAPETVRAILGAVDLVAEAQTALDVQTLSAAYAARKVPADRRHFLAQQTAANVSPEGRGDALIAALDQAREEVNARTVAAVKATKDQTPEEADPADAAGDGEPSPAAVKRSEGAAGDTATDRTQDGESDAAYAARILGTLVRWADTADRRATLSAAMRDALTTLGAADAADAAAVAV